MIELKPGLIYLVKGSYPLLNWVLYKNDLYPKVLLDPSFNEMSEIEVLNLGEPKSFILNTSKLSLQLAPDSNNYVFIPCADYFGVQSSQHKKMYKLAGGCYVSLDLTALDLTEDIYFDLEQYPNCTPIYLKYCQDIGLEPTTVESGLRLIDYLKMLGTKESIKAWENMPKKLIYSCFFLTDRKKSWAYKILVGIDSKRKNSKGMCPEIWLYLDSFLDRFEPEFTHYPNLLLAQFARWIWLSSTIWANKKNKGLTITQKGKYSYYNFSPSSISHQQFVKLLT